MIPYKIGFIGTGNMAQAVIRGLVEGKIVQPKQVLAANRSPGKLQKVAEAWGIQALDTNEEVIEKADIVVLAMKPQDMATAIDPLVGLFNDKQIVVSLAAGITAHSLKKKLPLCRIARVIPNTPALIGRGVIGYFTEDEDPGLATLLEDLFKPLGMVITTEDESALEGVMIACSAGTGFVFELMSYFQDWLEERGFDPIEARRMIIETFAGASLLAAHQKDSTLEDLQQKVTSKKGVTAAGLESMRELEVERLLRYSFEKAALRNQELAKQG